MCVHSGSRCLLFENAMVAQSVRQHADCEVRTSHERLWLFALRAEGTPSNAMRFQGCARPFISGAWWLLVLHNAGRLSYSQFAQSGCRFDMALTIRRVAWRCGADLGHLGRPSDGRAATRTETAQPKLVVRWAGPVDGLLRRVVDDDVQSRRAPGLEHRRPTEGD